MKIIKSTFLNKRKSEYGNFDLEPENGFELRTYIDYESKLLVVEESPIENPPGVPYLSKQYIINPQTGEILTFEKYKKYFNYNLQEIYSPDGKFKLEVRRIHDTERDRDYKEEKLIEVASGRVISDGKGIVFHNSKLKTALERHYDDLETRRKQIEEVAAQKTLEEHYELCKLNLKENHFILGYFDAEKVYKMIYSKGAFILSEGIKTSNVSEAEFKETMRFKTFDDFWVNFTNNEKWYSIYSPFNHGIKWKEDRLIAKFVISEANKIRNLQNFTLQEYEKLNDWENQVYTDTIRRNVYKQFCANCGSETKFSARYPKYICRKCIGMTTDSNGKRVTYSNTEMLGYGCQGVYVDGESKEKYDSNICYIGKSKFQAEEARFGGIVIQKIN